MPIQIDCACGKNLDIPDHLAGRKVKCPGCGNAVRVESPASVQESSSPPIYVECGGCGKKLKIRSHLVDRNLKCPGCDSVVQAETPPNMQVVKAWVKEQGLKVEDVKGNERDENGKTLVHCAAMSGQIDVLKWLKERGADVNAKNDNGLTPMHFAAGGNGEIDAMKWLKAQGVDINAKDNNGLTPMHYSVVGGQVKAMKWLKEQGADVNAKSKDGNTPLSIAKEDHKTAAVEWLKANGGRE